MAAYFTAITPDGLVPVRDSKSPEGPALLLPAHAWTPFVNALKSN